MDSKVIGVLAFTALGIFLIVQGLPGLLSSELRLRSKYGRVTRYTGNKATAMGFGMTAFGLLTILNGIVMFSITLPTKSPLLMAGIIVGVIIYLACWIISWFVSGTATRERR